MGKILEECHELRASSLAIPMIGAGQHGFLEEIVLQVIKNEVNNLSNTKGVHSALKDIRVIVFQSKPERRQSVPLPTRREISVPSTFDIKERDVETTSTEIAFGPVHVHLYGGSVTQYQADALMNLTSTSVRMSTTHHQCTNIGQNDEELEFTDSVREEPMKPPPNTVLIRKASDGANVKYYMHCVPVSFDISGIERAMKTCLDAAQFFPLNSIVVSATGITSLSVAPEECANAILNASKTFSNENFMIDITVVVFNTDMMRIFKNAFAEKRAKEQKMSLKFHESDHLASFDDATIEHQRPANKMMSIGAKEEVVFRVVGFHDNVNMSIQKIEAYFNRCKISKSIEDERIINGFWKHNSEIKKLSQGFDVFITLTSKDACIEGMAEQVFECKDVLTDFLNKYDEQERELKRLREISSSVQWSYSDVNGTVLFDEVLNGMVESEFRNGNKTLTLHGMDTTYELDLNKMVIEETHSGRTALLARKQMESTSGNFN